MPRTFVRYNPQKSFGVNFLWHENDLLIFTSRVFLWCSNVVYLQGGITVTNSIDCKKNLGLRTATQLNNI